MILEQLGNARHVLLLQGPMGRFFGQLADGLREAGLQVSKINFCAGDDLFFPQAVSYTGTLTAWSQWLEQWLREHDVDAILLFGDMRAYHRMAQLVARQHGIPVFVFEEGYLRPHWITFERGGVNGHSMLCRKDRSFHQEPPAQPELEQADGQEPVQDAFCYRAAVAALYYLACWFLSSRYPYYQHHREISWSELGRWMRGGLRKIWYAWRERHIMALLSKHWAGRAFLLPLQVHNDSQLWVHGGAGMEDYIRQVIASFARSALPDQALVIKHHPMDRAYRDYSALIRREMQQYRLHNRLFYIHDLHLPTLLRLTRAVVTVNSTVGMTALEYGLPVMTLGRSIYDMDGLTHQGTLDSFWRIPTAVDTDLFRRFRGWLVATCQLRGSVYARKALLDPRAWTSPVWIGEAQQEAA